MAARGLFPGQGARLGNEVRVASEGIPCFADCLFRNRWVDGSVNFSPPSRARRSASFRSEAGYAAAGGHCTGSVPLAAAKV